MPVCGGSVTVRVSRMNNQRGMQTEKGMCRCAAGRRPLNFRLCFESCYSVPLGRYCYVLDWGTDWLGWCVVGGVAWLLLLLLIQHSCTHRHTVCSATVPFSIVLRILVWCLIQ